MKPTLPVQVETVLKELSDAGWEGFLVGGCVRDFLRKVPPKDYDIATNALPQDVVSVFSGKKVIETGLKHGTVTVLEEGLPIQITTYRIDGEYSDGRHPDGVCFSGSLADDLARRDFTVNAMAYSETHGLVDLFGGADDLAAGILRCVGDPDTRFSEDALRILRGLRFASILGFKIEEQTARGMERCKERLDKISSERIASELTGLLCGENPQEILLGYADILGQVLPEILPMKGFMQNSPHHRYDVLTHTARVIAAISPIPVLRWAALFHDTGKPFTYTEDETGRGHFYGHANVSRQLARKALVRLKLDRETIERVDLLIRYHDAAIIADKAVVKRWLRKLSPEGFEQLLCVKYADNVSKGVEDAKREKELSELSHIAKEILEGEECFTLKNLAINGSELIEIGAKKGPEVGRLLEKLLHEVVEGRIVNRKEVLAEEARRILSIGEKEEEIQ